LFAVEIKRKLLTRVSTIIERTEGERGRLETLCPFAVLENWSCWPKN